MKTNDQLGQFNGPAEVSLVRLLPGPIERVWDYLTNSDKRARWLAAGPMEPRKGGKVTLRFRHKDIAPEETPPEEHREKHEKGHEMNGVVTRWEPPHVLAHTFGSDGESEVIFELSAQGSQVRLLLTHRATAGDLPYLCDFAAGWHTHLAHLIAQLEGGARPPLWPMMTRLKGEYAAQLATLTN
jgi:uncharacterized protein YndB with AHSA1/START domain